MENNSDLVRVVQTGNQLIPSTMEIQHPQIIMSVILAKRFVSDGLGKHPYLTEFTLLVNQSPRHSWVERVILIFVNYLQFWTDFFLSLLLCLKHWGEHLGSEKNTVSYCKMWVCIVGRLAARYFPLSRFNGTAFCYRTSTFSAGILSLQICASRQVALN